MGTKLNPGRFDCYAIALPDEPMFVLLARDPDFYRLVRSWADERNRAIRDNERPPEDGYMVQEAWSCAEKGWAWRKANVGRWRTEKAPPDTAVEAMRAKCETIARGSIMGVPRTREEIIRDIAALAGVTKAEGK
jgi:hypothetical protein